MRSTAALWITPLLQSPSFCCTVAFLWQSIFMMSPPPTAVIVAMEISSSVPNCCLRESVCKLTIVHVFVCACFCVGLCTRFIFNCYLQSAYWAQSVIREAQRGVNSWDSFTSVLMDFLYLCLLFPFLSLALSLCQSFYAALPLASLNSHMSYRESKHTAKHNSSSIEGVCLILWINPFWASNYHSFVMKHCWIDCD